VSRPLLLGHFWRLRRWLGVVAVSVAAAAPLLAAAPPSAQAGPLAEIEGETLDVQAEKLDVDVANGTAVLEGNVRATLGELEVLCPKVEIRYDEAPKVQWARGSGGVRAKLKGIDATASTVSVDISKRQVQLRGRVRLSRGKGWIEAERASIDLRTRKVTLRDVKGSIPVEPPRR
jgi:lipopolysaccharide transport protein LptA